MARPLSFRWPDEFVAAIDEARGDVSRSRWVRRAVEQALGSPEVPDAGVGVRGRVPALAPAEQPRTSEVEMQALRNIGESLHAPRVRSSAEARPFRPAPKKGKA